MPDSLSDTAAWPGDTIGEHLADPAAQALALDHLAGTHVVPFYQDQAAIDAAQLAMMRHVIFRAPPPPPSETPAGSPIPSCARPRPTTRPPSARSGRSTEWSARPDEVYTSPDVVACTRETLRRHGATLLVAQPTREQFFAALAR
jgi:hypothetical protein